MRTARVAFSIAISNSAGHKQVLRPVGVRVRGRRGCVAHATWADVPRAKKVLLAKPGPRHEVAWRGEARCRACCLMASQLQLM